MKIKKVSKKLVLNKSTMSNLNGEAMTDVKGGNLWESRVEETVCCGPTAGPTKLRCDSYMYCDSVIVNCDTGTDCTAIYC